MEETSYHFFIYSDNGSLIYRLSSEDNFDKSMQGIIQALFYTALDNHSELHTISSHIGILGYKTFSFNNKSLLFALIIPDNFGEGDLANLIIERILEYIYNSIIIHIGLIDAFPCNQNEIEPFRRLLDIYQPTLKHILSNYTKLSFLIKSECKYEVEKECIYPIKHYIELIKTTLKVDFICLTYNNKIAWCSQDWLAIDVTDRILFNTIAGLYSDNDIDEIPVYFCKTILDDDSTGKVAYKLFSINLLRDFKLIILADLPITIKRVSDVFNPYICDEFFISRLTNFKNLLLSENEFINSTVKSLVVVNNNSKTFKTLINDSVEDRFSQFITNTHFATVLFRGGSYDEFYIKDDVDCFYYYKYGSLTFMILYDKDITFDYVNNVKLNLKTYIENFEENDTNK